MNKIVLFLILFLSCVFPQDAAVLPAPDAGLEEFADSVVTIGEVSVVGKKAQEIIKPQSISGAELERLNSLSVADALRYFSGVQIKALFLWCTNQGLWWHRRHKDRKYPFYGH